MHSYICRYKRKEENMHDMINTDYSFVFIFKISLSIPSQIGDKSTTHAIFLLTRFLRATT